MPKSFGTIEEGFVNFTGGTQTDVYLNVETYGRGKIQCAIVEPTYFPSEANAGPQPPGATYLSGSEWTFSQSGGETTTDPCGQFVSFSGTPANLTWPTAIPYPHAAHAPVTTTKGAILLAKNTAGQTDVYLTSSETNLFNPAWYLVTFGLVRGQALSGISATWTDGNQALALQYRKKVTGSSSTDAWFVDEPTTDADGWAGVKGDTAVRYTDTSFSPHNPENTRVFNKYYRSTTGIGGPYTDPGNASGGNSSQGVKGGAVLANDAVYHFKRGFQVKTNEYFQIRWKFPATGVLGSGGTAVGLCDTIIEELFKDYGDNYGYIQISAQFVTDNHFRIYSSAPFWGQVAYSISS